MNTVEEERSLSVQLATDFRNKSPYALNAYFPVQEIARDLGLSCISDDENASRWLIALQIADYAKALDRTSFASELLVPLYILEPLINNGKNTGKKRFFGLLKVKESYTTWELASIFGCPELVIDSQAHRLYF